MSELIAILIALPVGAVFSRFGWGYKFVGQYVDKLVAVITKK